LDNETNRIVNFDVDSAEVIDDDPTSQFCIAKIQAFSSGANRHDLFCSEETLKRTASTIYNTPILYDIIDYKQDFGTHTEAGQSMIAGFTVPNSAEFTRLPDSRLSLNILARIWRRYAPKVVEFFKKSNDRKVSVEMQLNESVLMDDGLTEMVDFVYTGIALLGKSVTEACEGSHMQLLSFAEEKNKYDEALAKEFSSRYDNIDFSIPSKVKENAQEGLNLRGMHDRGGNSISLSLARHLSKDEKSNPEKIKHINKVFSGNRFDDMDMELPSDSYINFMLYGGNESKVWSKDTSDKIDEIDSKRVSYFEEILTFPYTKISDANPALRGIDPPISLGQANEIARQADAIGTDEKKNGWAIAISSFKKIHEVKDGKWIEKKSEKNMGDENLKEDNVNMDDKDLKKEEVIVAKIPKEKMAVEEKPKEDISEDEQEEKDEKKEKEEEDKEEEKEEKKEKMSLSANLDVKAILAMLADETEKFRDVAEGEFAKPDGEKDFSIICSAMFAKMCKMAEESKTYMAENAELKEFKSKIEKAEFALAVDISLKELENCVDIPLNKLEEMRTKSEEFNIETIDAWKNDCKILAFPFAVKTKRENGAVKRIGLPWMKESEKSNSIWENLNK
jgi:hypothetical protein